MSKKVKLTMSRFGSRSEFSHGSVKSAAQAACDDIESNEAAPIRIECNGATAWENTGPFDGSYERLREIAGLPSEST